MEVYGKFKNELGGYMIDKLPDAGNYECPLARPFLSAKKEK